MSTVKDELIKNIHTLPEEDLQKVLSFAQNLAKEKETSSILLELADDPDYVVNIEKRDFKKVQPTQGKGKPASQLLLEDRK